MPFLRRSGSLLLSYVPELVVKTDSATQQVPRSFTIPTLEELVGNDEAELRLSGENVERIRS